MKKTYSINVSGTVFHIDEDAYERLKQYLEGLKSHFKRYDGQDEIIADIEGRIAEILLKKISASKQVITIEDIEEVISIMGQPEEIDNEEEQSGGAQAGGDFSQPKRLYRDPDQKIIGGICSGIAAYFFIDPIWIRIIFLIITFSGFGILLYLILWIVVPEARTKAERLEMRGKPVNVSTLEQSIKEEVGHIKVKINDFTGKAKNTYQKGKENFDRNHRSQFNHGLSAAGHALVRMLMVVAGFIIFILGLILTFAFLALIFRVPFSPFMENSELGMIPLYPVMDMIFQNDADLRTFITGTIVIAGITLLMMLWGGIRLVFNLPRARFISGIALLIWICGLLITLIFGLKTYNSFHYEGESSKDFQLELQPSDTVRIITNYNLPENLNSTRKGYYHLQELNMVISIDDQIYYGIPQLRIRLSSDSTTRLIANAKARGSFPDEAGERAESIEYTWQQTSDTIFFSDSYRLAEFEKWRKQELKLDLYLPAGTVFSLDDKTSRILAGHPSMSRKSMAGKTFIMHHDGMKLVDN